MPCQPLVDVCNRCYNRARRSSSIKETKMKEHVATGGKAEEHVQAFAARYSFPLDTFQLEAMAHLDNGQSVLVAAPTGTGKTLVAEYAVWLAQQRQQRVIYTTPLKALSNQKYRDMRTLYGDDAVGLVTGDIVEHSRASIVIMTTEVYRNMLLEEGSERLTRTSLNDVGFVVFDELHYLSDVGRGPVWEEAIICSPDHVQLVGLSATVSNAEDLASWISRVHCPISLITHEQRAVPLEHYYFLDGKLHLVQDAEGNRVERFPNIGGEAKLASRGRRNFSYDVDDEAEALEEEEELADIWEERRRKRRGGRQQFKEERARSDATTTSENGATSSAAAHQQRPARPPQRKAPELG